MADHACLLQDNAEIKSFIMAASSRADLIINAAAIIWDELCMANVAAFEAVHNICCELKNSSKPFGGIPFVGAGDFRQIAPVVKGVGPSVSLMLASNHLHYGSCSGFFLCTNLSAQPVILSTRHLLTTSERTPTPTVSQWDFSAPPSPSTMPSNSYIHCTFSPIWKAVSNKPF